MRVIRSVLYGYLGAVLGGLLVAVVGIAFGYSEESIAAASVPAGVLFGVLGLSLLWWRPIALRTGPDTRRPDRAGRGLSRG